MNITDKYYIDTKIKHIVESTYFPFGDQYIEIRLKTRNDLVLDDKRELN